MTQEDEVAPVEDLDKRLKQLAHEVRSLREYLKDLNARQYVRQQLSLKRRLLISFLTGAASALGAIIGAALLLWLLLYILGRLEVVPIIGNWIARIIEVVEQARQ